jgi:ribosomal protein S18 acetylase RimI-like enzyme
MIMEIRKYTKNDESLLFDLIVDEGDEWMDYHSPNGRKKYRKAIASSIVYIALKNNELCGYVRCKDDGGFGIYIYDLLVKKCHRGKQLGRKLMEKVSKDYPSQTVYVMSDVDAYYKKLGYEKAGSIFVVK